MTEKREIMIAINEKENIDFLPMNTLMPQGNVMADPGWETELILPINFVGLWSRDIGHESWNILVKYNNKTYKILQEINTTMGRQITEQMVLHLKEFYPQTYGKSTEVNARNLALDFTNIQVTFAIIMTWKKSPSSGYYYRLIHIAKSVKIDEEEEE